MLRIDYKEHRQDGKKHIRGLCLRVEGDSELNQGSGSKGDMVEFKMYIEDVCGWAECGLEKNSTLFVQSN